MYEFNQLIDDLMFDDWDIIKLIMNQDKNDDQPLNLTSQDAAEQLHQLDVDQEQILIQNLFESKETKRQKTDDELKIRKSPEIITQFSIDSLIAGSTSSSFEIASPTMTTMTSATTFTPITPTSFHENIHYEHEEDDVNKDKYLQYYHPQKQQQQQQSDDVDFSALVTDCFGNIFDTKKHQEFNKVLEQLIQPSSSGESNVQSFKAQSNISSSVRYDLNDLRFLKKWETLHQNQKSKRQSSQLKKIGLTVPSKVPSQVPSHTQSSSSLSSMSKRKISLQSGSCFGSEPNMSLQPSSTYIPSQEMSPCKRFKVEDEITSQDYDENVCEDEFKRETICENEIKKLKTRYLNVVLMEQELHQVDWSKSKMNYKIMRHVQNHLESDNKHLKTKILNLTKLTQHLKSTFNQQIFQLKAINMIPFNYSFELNQSTSIESMMLINQLIESIKTNQSAISSPNDILNLNPCDILNPSEIINSSDIQVCTTETQTINEIHNPCDIECSHDLNPCDMTCDIQVFTTSTQTISETQLIHFEQQHSSQSDNDELQILSSADDDSNDLIDFDDIFHSEYHQ